MDYEILRKRMVNEQLKSRGIANRRVLDAFLKIERHKFVPEKLISNSYADFPLPIGEGQTISQPYIVALMTEELDLNGAEKVLEIGTGSGYQTAILAELVKEIYTVERFPDLSSKAKEILDGLGYKNIKFVLGDGTLGLKQNSPFDRIIVTAATKEVPKLLLEQLKEGGKLILPLGETFSQVLTLIQKHKDSIEQKKICDCVFVPLVSDNLA